MNNFFVSTHLALFLLTMTLLPLVAVADDPVALPPHRAKQVQGVHAYTADSVAAGDEISFHVSSTVDYRFSLIRLGTDAHSTAKDEVMQTVTSAAAPRPIFPGSYAHIDKPCAERVDALTISCWVRPFRVDGPRQAIVTRRRDDAAGGCGLFLEKGGLVLEAGPRGEAGKLRTKENIVSARRWHHLVAALDGKTRTIWLDGKQVASRELADETAGGSLVTDAPWRLGAAGNGAAADYFLDGDLACCAIYPGLLSDEQVGEIRALRGLKTIVDPKPLAYWDFAEEQGERLRDRSGGGHDGRIINLGTWMVGGPSFDARGVDRYDADYDPRLDEKRGHALRLASDDLYDCRWPVVQRVRIPKTAPSGFYCGRFEYETDGKPYQHNVTFVVRAAVDAPTAPILVLAATNTWRAYNWFPFVDNQPSGRRVWHQGDAGNLTSDKSLPAYCLYRDHQSGQPTYKVGLNMPRETGDPYRCYRGGKWGQWVQNERLAHLWLDRQHYPYEVVTDLDLHRRPELLKDRKVLMIIGHSEYWSTQAYDAVEHFLDNDGNVIVLSGNSLFWRVDFDQDLTTMHCRKFGTGMLGSAWTMPGELFHTGSATRGGLLRFCGKPAWAIIGLETAGWCEGMDFLPYTVSNPDHFLFQRPHKVNLNKGDRFGYFQEIGIVGHEYDVRPSILVAATPKMPPGYEDVRDPPGMEVLANCKADRKIADYEAVKNFHRKNPSQICSEILYWKRPAGGRVFNIGSVAAPWGLYYDKHVGLLVQNVLDHFGVQPDK